MKNYIKKILGILLIPLITISIPITSFAYDEDDYDLGISEDGTTYWYVDSDERGGLNSCAVNMYVYTEKFYNTNTLYYVFDAFSDNLPEEYKGEAKFCYPITFMSAKDSDMLEKGDIYQFRFLLEPGRYCFSSPDGRDNNDFMVLTSRFTSPMTGAGFYTATDNANGMLDIVNLADDEVINIYAYIGSGTFMKDAEAISEFTKWANDKEIEWQNHLRDMGITYDTYSEKINPRKGSVEIIEEEPEEVSDFVPNDGPVRSENVEKNVIEKEVETPESKVNIPLITGLIVGIGAIIGFAIYIKRRFF